MATPKQSGSVRASGSQTKQNRCYQREDLRTANLEERTPLFSSYDTGFSGARISWEESSRMQSTCSRTSLLLDSPKRLVSSLPNHEQLKSEGLFKSFCSSACLNRLQDEESIALESFCKESKESKVEHIFAPYGSHPPHFRQTQIVYPLLPDVLLSSCHKRSNIFNEFHSQDRSALNEKQTKSGCNLSPFDSNKAYIMKDKTNHLTVEINTCQKNEHEANFRPPPGSPPPRRNQALQERNLLFSPQESPRHSVRFRQDVQISPSQRLQRQAMARSHYYSFSSEDEDSLSDGSPRSQRCLLRRAKTSNRENPKSQITTKHRISCLEAAQPRDLRSYLIRKAHQNLIPPHASFESDCDDTDISVSSSDFRSDTSLQCSPVKSPPLTSSLYFDNSENKPSPREVGHRIISSRGSDIYRGNVACRSRVGPRGALLLDRVCEWHWPRDRNWSLPTIIVTQTDIPNSSRDTEPDDGHDNDAYADSCSESNASLPMQYLKIPESELWSGPTLRRNFNRRRSSSCQDLRHVGIVRRLAEPKPSLLQLGSLLNLCPSVDEEEQESEDTEGNGVPNAHEVLNYENSYMYGRYSADLAEFAYTEGKKIRDAAKEKVDDLFTKELHPYKGTASRFVVSFIRPIWTRTFARIGEEWVFLFFLGFMMAFVSFGIDAIIGLLFKARIFFHDILSGIHWALSLFLWLLLPTLLVMFGVSFTAWVAPSAAGSGIPEMKTILRGVVLKEYLTWRTLVAKIVGLIAVIGAGLPLGKEGPVMHMASIVATLLSKLLRVIKGTVENEQRNTELLAAACTMGVSVCYAAPIGGVLFSIEVTTTYFAVRNYWRGFFAAIIGALFYRLFGVWFMGHDTIYPLFKVNHNYVYPYDVIELFPFFCLSIVCSFMGAGFVFVHRRYVMFMRHNKFIKKFLMKNRMMYPMLVTILIMILLYPDALGQFMGTRLTTTEQVLQLFSNVTWGSYGEMPAVNSEAQENILKNWTNKLNPSFLLSLFVFGVTTLLQIILASTLPVANGVLVPLMKVGAAFGRIVGEIMVATYPSGIVPGYSIVPGAYAMVGAASFCSSITHAISISVIIFELTGQITYVIPILLGVLISNTIASLLQPSIYDSVIRIKKLPYLPDIVATASTDVYNTFVEDIMVKDISYIWYGMTYTELKKILKENRRIKFFPLVDGHQHMILLGSIKRLELVRLLLQQISPEKRRKEAQRRQIEALKQRWMEEDAMEARHQSKIRYEDEVQSSSEENTTSENILMRMGRSFTRSISRSRSTSRIRSSEDDSPKGDVTSLPLELPLDHQLTVHSSSSTAKLASTATSPPLHIRDLFSQTGQKTSPSNDTTSKTVSTVSDDKSDDKGKTRSGDHEKSSSHMLAPLKKIQSKLAKDKTAKQKEVKKIDSEEEERIFSAARKASLVKRSNSLDNLKKAGLKDEDTHDDEAFSDDADGKLSESLSPKKGILKRRNSFSMDSLNIPSKTTASGTSEGHHYQTITVADTKLRSAFDKMRKLKMETATSMELKLSQLSLFKPKKKEYPVKRHVVDLTGEERESWEQQQLVLEADFDLTTIDPAPFQLVERTSLLRVHSLFSLLGINHAYVTNIGRLRGVVALKEIRLAIEGTNEKIRQKPKDIAKAPDVPVVVSSPQQMTLNERVSALHADPEVGLVRRGPNMRHQDNGRI